MKLLYSFIFSFFIVSSAFASTSSPDCSDLQPPFVKSVFGLGEVVGCLNPNYYKEETFYDCSSASINETVQYYGTGFCSGDYEEIVQDKYYLTPVSKCPEGQSPNDEGVCEDTPAPECGDGEYLKDGACTKLGDGEYLDADGNPQPLPKPDDFPTSDDKGIDSTRESTETSPSDCVPGTTIHTGIMFATVLAWDYSKNKCIYSTFFCNNGLTWNNIKRTCEVPPSEKSFNPDEDGPDNSDSISPELANACTSGKWAKKWTHDYCGLRKPCYIGLDAQGYNLQCGNKYLEYQCTSDYRIKKFLQVSCGNPSKEDYDEHDMDTDPTNDIVPPEDTKVNPDPNDANASAILNSSIDEKLSTLINNNHADLASIDTKLGLSNKLLDGISKNGQITNSKLDSINSNISTTNSKLDTTNSKLDAINESIKANNNNDDDKNIIGNFTDGKNSLNLNDIPIDTSSLDETSTYMDNLEDNLAYLTDDITSIKTQYTNLKTTLSGDIPPVIISSGSCSDENMQKFAGYIAPYSSVFALFTYVSLMLSIFKMIFMYMSRGEN